MTQISNNIYWQMKGEGVFQTINVDDIIPKPDGALRFMHVLNLFDSNKKMDLDDVQLTTLESMKTARALMSILTNNTTIDFISVNTPEDASLVPDIFLENLKLKRDVTSVENFLTSRRFPMIFDILQLADNSLSCADTIIFTNSDICLTPSFYYVVKNLLDLGFDSIIINRRTVHGINAEKFSSLAVADHGETHPGLDCFIFPRKWINTFSVNTACVGAGYVMRGLLLNIVAQAQSLLVLTEAHLTYHFGDARLWAEDDMKEYQSHNFNQAKITYNKLSKEPVIAKKFHDLFETFPKYQP